MRTVKFIILLIALGVIISCTKKQRYQNRIGGKWRLTQKLINGTAVDLKSKTYMFDFGCIHCEENQATYYSDSDSASAFEYINYAFSKNGKQLTLMYETNVVEKYEVKELKSKSMELRSKQNENIYKFEKEKED